MPEFIRRTGRKAKVKGSSPIPARPPKRSALTGLLHVGSEKHREWLVSINGSYGRPNRQQPSLPKLRFMAGEIYRGKPNAK